MKTKYNYLQVATDPEIKEEVARLAREERRSMADQGAVIFELGLEEYRRREEFRRAVNSGSTQIAVPMTEADRNAALERMR